MTIREVVREKAKWPPNMAIAHAIADVQSFTKNALLLSGNFPYSCEVFQLHYILACPPIKDRSNLHRILLKRSPELGRSEYIYLTEHARLLVAPT